MWKATTTTGNDKTSRTNSLNSTVLHVLATHTFLQFGLTLLQSKFNLQLKQQEKTTS